MCKEHRCELRNSCGLKGSRGPRTGVGSGRTGPKGDVVGLSSSPVSSLPALSPGPSELLWVGDRGAGLGFTYEPELLGVLKALPSSNEKHSCIDARVEAGLHIKSLAIPGVRVGGHGAGLMPTASFLIPLAQPTVHSFGPLTSDRPAPGAQHPGSQS